MQTTITHFLLEAQDRSPRQIAFRFKTKKIWRNINWTEFYESCNNLGCALLSLGVDKGERIAITGNTCYEWALSDLAILGIGAITVPIYQSSKPEEIEYILNNCQANVFILEDDVQYKKWLKIRSKCPSVKTVISMKNIDTKDDSIIFLQDFLNRGEQHKEQNPEQFEKLCLENKLEDTATIIYTSGTTGQPKGVVLRHQQIMSEISEVFPAVGVTSQDVTLSFLPYAHVMGRIELWGSIYKGYTIAFAESIERIKYNLIEVQPTLLIAVPRIFEKIYNGVIAQAETSKLKSNIFNWAMTIGSKVSKYKTQKKPIPLQYILQYRLAKKLVFDKLKEKMGGRLRYAISGGAPLPKAIGEFFHASGLLLLEGYGLSETTAAICLNTPLNYSFGTVGKPLPDVEIKFEDDGEVLVKSDKVMKEYYLDEEATKAAFNNGFFRTGDIGKFTKDGFLKITDRKKDLIKTAGGKYVAPQKIESFLKLSQYVSNVLVHGDQKKYIVALVTLDEENINKYALENKISHSSLSSLATNEEIKKIIREVVAEANSKLSSYETIKNFEILPKDFTVEDGELTPSMKVKRKYCDQKYAEIIERLYGVDRSSL